ncbi:MAG: hypothetical protein ACOC5T_04965 [Elusimicrobiota bacterium]
MIYKKALKKKIHNIIKDLFDNRIKSYKAVNDLSSKYYWAKYLIRDDSAGEPINTNRYPRVDKILKKYQAAYLGEGMSRIGFEIKHNNETFVFKLCFDNFFIEQSFISEKNENQLEFNNIKTLSKNSYLKSLILPVVDYFYDSYGKDILVMPKIHVGFEHDKHRYNSHREDIIRSLCQDAHEGNVGQWKNLHWLFDVNSKIYDHDMEYVIKRHEKYISTSKTKGTKHRFKKAKKLINEFALNY